MAAKRGGHKAEIKRLSGIAKKAIERERSHRARLSKRGRRLANSGKAVGLASVAGLMLLAMVRKRHHRDDGKAVAGRHPDIFERAGDEISDRLGDRILELARLGLTTSRLWKVATDRR